MSASSKRATDLASATSAPCHCTSPAFAGAHGHRPALGKRVEECGELDAIGGRVALEEEVQRLVGADALGVGELDVGRRHVLDAQPALGAEQLDALVVAVAGAPAVVDVR